MRRGNAHPLDSFLFSHSRRSSTPGKSTFGADPTTARWPSNELLRLLLRAFRATVCRVLFFRNGLVRLGIEGGALLREDAAFDGEVVAEGVADEVDRVVVARLEINRMHFVAPSAVDDAADASPKTGHGAHP